MTELTRKTIIRLHKIGHQFPYIQNRTKCKLKDFKEVISDLKKEKKMFNVDEFQDWIFPLNS